MLHKSNIFLIGPMGAGKSTIGHYLAKEFNKDFYDTDQEVEHRTGVDVRWIFDVEGEDGFRKRETEVLDDLSQKSNVVIATGGGIITQPENRVMLSARGFVIYLTVSLEQQARRLEKDKKRPLLHDGDTDEILSQLRLARAPLYAEVADMEFSTEGSSVMRIAEKLAEKLRQGDYL